MTAPNPADASPPPAFRDATAAASVRAGDARASRLAWLIGGLAVLLAVVAGTRTVASPEVLRHAAFGRAIAAGEFPDGTDRWSATAAGRPWAEVTWLFDLLLGVSHAAAGPVAWSILSGVVAAGLIGWAIYAVADSRTRARAIVPAALLIPALLPGLTPTPDLVTPLMTAILIGLISGYRISGATSRLVAIVVLVALWANVDRRAFVGPAVLVIYAAGDLIGVLLGRGSFDDRGRRVRFLVTAGLSVVALAVGPFPIAQLGGAFELYGTHDAGMRAYLSESSSVRLAVEPFWAQIGSIGELLGRPGVAAALILFCWAVGEAVLAFGVISGGELLLLAGFAAFACVSRRELPVAAAGLALTTILLLRGVALRRGAAGQSAGVALPAFATGVVLAVGVLLASGRIEPDDGTKPGLGLAPAFSDEIEELAAAVDGSFDDRPFNFRAREGDALVWLGKRPFVDSRYGLFGGSSEDAEDLLTLHDEVRYALLSRKDSVSDEKAAAVGKPDVWREAFDRFDITHVVVRLSQPNPAYFVHVDLLLAPEWLMTRMTGSASVFYRGDVEEELDEYLRENSVRFLEMAFADVDDDVEGTARRPGWGRASDEAALFTFGGAAEPTAPAGEQRARHYLTHLKLATSGNFSVRPELLLAFAHLAIRDLDAALAEDTTRAAPYRLLGETYRELDRIETAIAAARGGQPLTRRRLYQSLNALGQAAAIDPADSETLFALLQTYRSYGKVDLALAVLDRLREVGDKAAAASGSEGGSVEATGEDAGGATGDGLDAVRLELVRAIDPISELVAKAAEQGVPKVQIATAAWQQGATRIALDVIPPPGPEPDVALERFRAQLLLEAARPAEAAAVLRRVAEGDPAATAVTAEPLALGLLGLAAYEAADELWTNLADEAAARALVTTMGRGPLFGPVRGKPPLIDWVQSVELAVSRSAAEIGSARLNAAMSVLESGRVDEAAERLETLVSGTPPNPALPLAVEYLRLIRGATEAAGGDVASGSADVPASEPAAGGAD